MLKTILVPAMLVLSSTMMAFAWIGHLKYHKTWSFLMALGISWMIVLPEYILNVSATRYGRDVYSAAQMATFNLSSGVVCVALVAHFFLKEKLATHQVFGFVLMVIAVVLITYRGPEPTS
ncbi:MAG: DMT family protein [Planctomycetota bacterium]